MIKHILVPLDGSEYSEHSLTFACEIAEGAGARLTTLMVLPTGEDRFPRSSEPDAHGKSLASDYLQRVNEKISTKIPIERRVEFGQPSEVITKVAEQEKADLIVMSTHGLGSSTQRVYLGSTALRVLQSAPCPVTMVRIY